MTLHIMAAIAEGEALAISERTKAGLAALKARGFWSAKKGRYVTLGMPNLTPEQRAKVVWLAWRPLNGTASSSRREA